jgi:hypothetical protein
MPETKGTETFSLLLLIVNFIEIFLLLIIMKLNRLILIIKNMKRIEILKIFSILLFVLFVISQAYNYYANIKFYNMCGHTAYNEKPTNFELGYISGLAFFGFMTFVNLFILGKIRNKIISLANPLRPQAGGTPR